LTLKWLPTLANLAAIVAFGLLVWGYFDLRPTLVKLRPEPIPTLSGLGAYEDVSPLGGQPLDQLAGPALWLEGFVTNDGTALASGLALELALQEPAEDRYGEQFRPVTHLLLGVVGTPSSYVSDVASAIPWNEWASLLPFAMADSDGWARLYLPPIPPGTYLQVFVGLPVAYCQELTVPVVQAAFANGLDVRLIHLTEATKARFFDGEQPPGKPELLDEIHLPFRNAYLDWHGVED
jgi:hypothetical protein